MRPKSRQRNRVCKRCILDAGTPGVKIDPKSGLCQFCRDHVSFPQKRREAFASQLDTLLRDVRGSGNYDAIFALSGGKDSCYTLYQLRNLYSDLRILAIQFDNGFISDTAIRNARHFCDITGSEYRSLAIDHEVLFDAFRRAATSSDVYSRLVKYRTSDICNTCISIIKQKFVEQALRDKAPLIIFGFTPGQTSNPIIKLTKSFIVWSRNQFESGLAKMGITDRSETFLLKTSVVQEGGDRGDFFILHPLCVWEYNKDAVRKTCLEHGWIAPKLDDANSTNCKLNTFAIFNHLKKYRIHPYAYDVAELVRSGHMERDEGLRTIYSQLSTQLIHDAQRILNIPE